MVVAHAWWWLVHGGHSSMVTASSWWPLVHGSQQSMATACPWQQLVHGGCSYMVAACPWQPLVHRSRSSIEAARPWWLLVHGGCSSMNNCVILKGNSSCGSCNENHVINSYRCAGGTILPQSILHSATKHFAFCDEAFCILLQSILYGFATEL